MGVVHPLPHLNTNSALSEMATEKYLQLVFKRLTEGLTEAEAAQLDVWLQASADNRQAAAEVESIFNASAQEVPPVDIPVELAALKSRLRAEAKSNPEINVTHRAPRHWWWAAAAVLLTLLAAVFFLREGSVPAAEWTSVSSGNQQNQVVNLPDGSRVWLNSQSEIAFVKNLNEQAERQVRLKGEAFFEVAKDPGKPFEVETEGCRIRVLGTSFNVRARKSEPTVSVAVRTGKVQVASQTDAAVLTPGQQLVLEKNTQKLTLSTPGDTYVGEWRTPEMAFQNLELSMVVQRLNQRFDQPILLGNPALADCRYSGYFPKADLAGILTNLQAVFGVTIKQTTDGILLEGGSCPE